MLSVNGSDGGGQLVRMAVALAAVEGTPVEIVNVRGNRKEPGLRPQHIGAIKAVAAVSDGAYEGVTKGSERVTFEPGDTVGGKAEIDIGTAGSIPLLFDTMLPLSVVTTGPIEIQATGGTDVKWAPPLDYLQYVKQSVLETLGIDFSLSESHRGFYPAGGGSVTLKLNPSTLKSDDFTRRGKLESVAIRSVETADLAEADVADRQITGVTEKIDDSIGAPVRTRAETVDSRSTGTVVTIVAMYEKIRAGFSALGEPGVPAESIGESAADQFLEFDSCTGAVDSHLADQLLPFLALCGGSMTTPTLTKHLKSERALLETFGYDIEIEDDVRPVRINCA